MKKLLTMIMSLVMAFAVAVTAGPTAQAAPAGTEEVLVDGGVYHKTVGMPYYGVPDQIPRIEKSSYVRASQAKKLANSGIGPRMVAVIQFEPDGDGGWQDWTRFVCDGEVILNDDVPMVDFLEVWPEGSNPMNTLAIYDNGTYMIPLGIESWEELFKNSSGWPRGTAEDTFVAQTSGLQWLRDPGRNPFKDPESAWIETFLEMKRRVGGQGVIKLVTPLPIVNTEELCVQAIAISFKRKLWLVAQRQPDLSYKYFFLKKYNKKNPDYSDKNNLGSLEEAIAYLKGK